MSVEALSLERVVKAIYQKAHGDPDPPTPVSAGLALHADAHWPAPDA